ncbi:hypothetical protein EIP86_009453 [Pleurotus ostreatoroseus]|nr:hypothetical protein EIP86_009453 [Pleurotus ostreatoroseus]
MVSANPFVDPLLQTLATSPWFDMFDNSFMANTIDNPSISPVSAATNLELDCMLGTSAVMTSLDHPLDIYNTTELLSDPMFAVPYTFAWNTNTTAENQAAAQDERPRQYENASTPSWNALGLTGISIPSASSLCNVAEVESPYIPTLQDASPLASNLSRKRPREEEIDIDDLSPESFGQQQKKRNTPAQHEERPGHEAKPLPNGRWMCTCGNPNTYSRKHDVTRHASKKSICLGCKKDLCRFDALQRHMVNACKACRDNNPQGTLKSDKQRRKQRAQKSRKASSYRK